MATAFPVRWHVGRHRVLPVTATAAWEPAHEDSWKRKQKPLLPMSSWNEMSRWEFLPWGSWMENLLWVGHDEVQGIPVVGMKFGNGIRLSSHHADVERKCCLWGLRRSPRAVCTFCCGLWGQTCSQHKSNQHGSKGVSRASGLYQTWLSFPLEVTCAVTGGNVTCRNITMQKSHWFVRDKVTYNSVKQVFAQLQPWFYWYSKHGCWALEKDSLFLLMLYIKTFICTRTQILFCISGSICSGRCIWSEQRGTCSVQAHQLDLQFRVATKLETATTRVTFLALSC